MDIGTFIRACLDEDEQTARTAIDPKHRGDWAWRKDSRTTVRTRDGVPIGPEARGVEIGPHIAKWSPARVLREVEAKRRIIAWHRLIDGLDAEGNPVRGCCNCIASGAEPPHLVTGPCMTLRLLALPFADHPDFRNEWRP